jgi:hypothetical protein
MDAARAHDADRLTAALRAHRDEALTRLERVLAEDR